MQDERTENEPLSEKNNARICAETEKRVLAYCGRAGLFPPINMPLDDQSESSGSAAFLKHSADMPRHVIAAVSGGADSMALLHILLALAPKLALKVAACHVNHGMRGENANRDEAFVRAECKRLGVPLKVFSAVQDGVSVPENAGEEWARKLRYGYFSRYGAEKHVLVATAHTLSDQAETLLFRLARGTGVHGAAGIAPNRGLYIRPLLCLTRQDTERYCAACGQAFVTDETNENDAFARNRIRHEAVPALAVANTGAVRNLGAFCAKMARADAYFAAHAETLLKMASEQAGGTLAEGPWQLACLSDAEPLIRCEALRQLVAPVRDTEEKYIALLETIVQNGCGAVQLTDAVRFCAGGGYLRREALQPQPIAAAAPNGCCDRTKSAATSSRITLQDAPEYPFGEGVFDFGGGYRVKIERAAMPLGEKTQSVHKKDLKNEADYAKISMLSFLRTRRAGDTYRPAGRGVQKTMKKWQNEEKTAVTERCRMPLLALGSEVIWLWGSGFADGFAPTEHTKEILRITPLAQKEE